MTRNKRKRGLVLQSSASSLNEMERLKRLFLILEKIDKRQKQNNKMYGGGLS